MLFQFVLNKCECYCETSPLVFGSHGYAARSAGQNMGMGG